MARQPQEGRARRWSPVWAYFNSDGRCKRCSGMFRAESKKHGTGGLWNHLRSSCWGEEDYAAARRHAAARRNQLETGGRRVAAQVGTRGRRRELDDGEPVGPGGARVEQAAARHLARLFALRGYHLSLLDDDCFRSFLHGVNPDYRLPTREATSELCDSVVEEARTELVAELRGAPGRVTLAVGRAQTMRGEAIYTACHFIDGQWRLRRVVLDAYVVAPAIGYHDPLVGVNEVAPDWLPERVVADFQELAILPHKLYKLAGEMTDAFQSRLLADIAQQLGHTTTTTYMDNALHSAARCLVLDKEFTDEVFGDVQLYNMNRSKREWLFDHLGLDCSLEYGEQWYSWYCTLETMRRGGLNVVDGSKPLVELVCNVWGEIYRAIKRISASGCPASDLCPVLLRVSDVLQTEIDNRQAHQDDDGSHEFTGFHGGRSAVDVLGDAKATLDRAIRDSYLLWSIPLALDPRHKLTTSIFQSVFGPDEAPDRIAEVRRKMHDLYTASAPPAESSQPSDNSELDRYLDDDAVDFDVLEWWKDYGTEQYQTVAQMARDVLATPTCGRLPSEKMAQVSSIVRGYTKEKHIRPEGECQDEEEVDDDEPEDVPVDILVVLEMMEQQDEKVAKAMRSMRERIASLEKQVCSGTQHQPFKSIMGASDALKNLDPAPKGNQADAKDDGMDTSWDQVQPKSPKEGTRKSEREKLSNKSDVQIRPLSEKMLKPTHGNKDEQKNHQTPISTQDFRCTQEDNATNKYIDSAHDRQRLVHITDIILETEHLKQFRLREAFLDDRIVAAYIRCLREDERLKNRDGGKVYLEDPVFTQSFKVNGMNLLKYGRTVFPSWLSERAKKYLNYDMVFLTINIEDKHWYLAVINTRLQTIQVLDSQGPEENREELTTTLIGLESCLDEIQQGRPVHQHKYLNIASWRFIDEVRRKMQTDGSSCGLFMLKYMECWTGSKLSPCFTQEDINYFRQKLPVLLVDSKHNQIQGGPKSSQTDGNGYDTKDSITID